MISRTALSLIVAGTVALPPLACSSSTDDANSQTAPITPGVGEAGAGGSTAVGAPGAAGETAVVPEGGAGGDSALPEGMAGAAAGGETAMGGTSAGGAGGEGGEPVGPGGPSGPSLGCGQEHADEPRGDYATHAIDVQGLTDEQTANGEGQREYFTFLPNGYDANRAYPIVFYGPGCGANGVEGTPLTGSLNGEAILVFLLQRDGCFSTRDDAAARSPELNYFEQVLSEVQDNYCTEQQSVFVSGYSSGGWLSNLLACHHGDKIRAIGTAAGGFRPPVADCVGEVAAIMHAGTQDDANPISRLDENGVEYGSIAGRNRLIDANGCNPDVSEPWDPEYPDCIVFQDGCPTHPVVWCEEDTGHSNGGQVSATGFWKFWSSLPSL